MGWPVRLIEALVQRTDAEPHLLIPHCKLIVEVGLRPGCHRFAGLQAVTTFLQVGGNFTLAAFSRCQGMLSCLNSGALCFSSCEVLIEWI